MPEPASTPVPQTLRSAVTTLLHDVTQAQSSINALSAELSRKYRYDPILRNFPVPNAVLEEVAIRLRFAFAANPTAAVPLSNGGDDASAPAASTLPTPLLAMDLAHEAVALLAWAIQQRQAREKRPGEAPASFSTRSAPVLPYAGGQRGVDPTAQRQQRHTMLELMDSVDFRETLRRELADRLQVDTAVAALDPTMDHTAAARQSVRDALNAALAKLASPATPIGPATVSPPLPATAILTDGDTVLAEARLARALASVLREQPGASPAELPDVPILLSAQDLSGLADEAIQSIRVRASLRNYKWVIVQDGDLGEDQLLPDH